jgi:hypothetical protein
MSAQELENMPPNLDPLKRLKLELRLKIQEYGATPSDHLLLSKLSDEMGVLQKRVADLEEMKEMNVSRIWDKLWAIWGKTDFVEEFDENGLLILPSE